MFYPDFILLRRWASQVLFPAALPLLLLLFCSGPEKPVLAQESGSPSTVIRWPQGKKAALSLTFDDARVSQVDRGLPFFTAQGIRVTFYVNPGALAKRLEGWKKAVRQGHEIGNHSVRHPCSGNFSWTHPTSTELENYTLPQMRRELLEANRMIREQLGVTPATFAYPCGQKFVGRGIHLLSTVPLIAELFQAGRGYNDESINDPLHGDLAQLASPSIDNLEYAQVKPLVDLVLSQGGWLVFSGHDLGDEEKRQTTRLSTLKALIEDTQKPGREIWVDTVLNISAYLRKTLPDKLPS